MSLDTLPEEILLNIFYYLDAVEKVNIGKVCDRFRRICLDRDILKILNFKKNYNFHMAHLKQFSRKISNEIVTVINLNGIYWPPSYQLRNALIKFVNLIELYLVDTHISMLDICTVFETVSKVRKLAISLQPMKHEVAIKKRIKIPLTHLLVTYNSYATRDLYNFVMNFETLEELWIIEPSIMIKYDASVAPNWFDYIETMLRVVTKRIVVNCQISKLRGCKRLFQYFEVLPDDWMCVENIHSDSVFYVIEKFNDDSEWPCINSNLPFEEQLQKIDNYMALDSIICASDKRKMIKEGLNYSDMNYTAVQILTPQDEQLKNFYNPRLTTSLFKWLLFSQNFACLKRLHCDTALFGEYNEVAPGSAQLSRKRRIGVVNNVAKEDGPFARFTRHATEIEDFELIDNDSKMFFDGIWRPDCLKYIQNWKMLRKLTISSKNIKNGKFLIEIAQNCDMLTVLKFKHDCVVDTVTMDLCKALPSFKNLKDFRYERKGAMVLNLLLIALARCKTLERVYIQCRFASHLSREALACIIENCNKLLLLFVYIEELPVSVCRSMTKALRKLAADSRFNVQICGQDFGPGSVRYMKLPLFHIQEVLCHSSDFYMEFVENFYNNI